MTLRLLGLVVVALSLAVACGSGQDPSLEGDVSTEEVDGAAAHTDLDGLVLTVELPDALVAGQPVTWRLTVTNKTDEDLTLAFPSGKQGEVVLTGESGAEAYRWSDGMMFSQALTEVPVAAGADVTFELPGELDVEPGSYLLVASVPSEPAPEALSREVTVTG